MKWMGAGAGGVAAKHAPAAVPFSCRRCPSLLLCIFVATASLRMTGASNLHPHPCCRFIYFETKNAATSVLASKGKTLLLRYNRQTTSVQRQKGSERALLEPNPLHAPCHARHRVRECRGPFDLTSWPDVHEVAICDLPTRLRARGRVRVRVRVRAGVTGVIRAG